MLPWGSQGCGTKIKVPGLGVPFASLATMTKLEAKAFMA